MEGWLLLLLLLGVGTTVVEKEASSPLQVRARVGDRNNVLRGHGTATFNRNRLEE